MKVREIPSMALIVILVISMFAVRIGTASSQQGHSSVHAWSSIEIVMSVPKYLKGGTCR